VEAHLLSRREILTPLPFFFPKEENVALWTNSLATQQIFFSAFGFSSLKAFSLYFIGEIFSVSPFHFHKIFLIPPFWQNLYWVVGSLRLKNQIPKP